MCALVNECVIQYLVDVIIHQSLCLWSEMNLFYFEKFKAIVSSTEPKNTKNTAALDPSTNISKIISMVEWSSC